MAYKVLIIEDDEYNRLLSVTNPLSKTTRYDYAPAQGNVARCQR